MHWIIVKRGDFQLYDRLYDTFGAQVPVIWDRRRGTHGASGVVYTQTRAVDLERRQGEPPCWSALGFVVVNDISKSSDSTAADVTRACERCHNDSRALVNDAVSSARWRL